VLVSTTINNLAFRERGRKAQAFNQYADRQSAPCSSEATAEFALASLGPERVLHGGVPRSTDSCKHGSPPSRYLDFKSFENRSR
jgi:hypothetical protein